MAARAADRGNDCGPDVGVDSESPKDDDDDEEEETGEGQDFWELDDDKAHPWGDVPSLNDGRDLTDVGLMLASAPNRRGAGQVGRTCGRQTTRNETMSVDVKSDVV